MQPNIKSNRTSTSAKKITSGPQTDGSIWPVIFNFFHNFCDVKGHVDIGDLMTV